MTRLWDRDLVARSSTIIGATLSLIIVIFLAEQMATLVETLVENRISFGNMPWILTLTAPEIVVTAMPLAVLIGVYKTLLDARDANETIAMAGCGVGTWGLLRGMAGLGVVAMLVVVVTAGWIDPASRSTRDLMYASAAHDMAVAAVRDGLETDHIRQLNGFTLLSRALPERSDRGLVILFPSPGGQERIVSAHHYELVDGEVNYRFRLQLRDVVVSDIGSNDDNSIVEGFGSRVGTYTQEIDLADTLRDPALESRLEYQTLTGLASVTGEGLQQAAWMRALELLTRSTLSVIVVFIAALAVTFGHGQLRLLPLPLAGAATIALDLGLIRLARACVSLPPILSAMVIISVVAALIYGLGRLISVRQTSLVAPRRGAA